MPFVFCKVVKTNLRKLDGSTDLVEFCLHLFCLFLGDSFLDGLGSAVNEGLRIGKAKAGDLTDDLDDLDLVGADLFQDNVKLGFLFSSSIATGSRAGNSNSGSGGNAEFFFNSVNELRQLENGHGFDLFKESSNFLRSHGIFLH